mmetsp:Transcript_19821/g.36916  ORF Transcript_19821/g.36916 Transcript_19821/m.36916 type:complete len:437 (-) Transcript_19821:28-1338(-)
MRVGGVYGSAELLHLVLILGASAAVHERHYLGVSRALAVGPLGQVQGGPSVIARHLKGDGVVDDETSDDDDVVVVGGRQVQGLMAHVVFHAKQPLLVYVRFALVQDKRDEVRRALPLDGVSEGGPAGRVSLEDLVHEANSGIHQAPPHALNARRPVELLGEGQQVLDGAVPQEPDRVLVLKAGAAVFQQLDDLLIVAPVGAHGLGQVDRGPRSARVTQSLGVVAYHDLDHVQVQASRRGEMQGQPAGCAPHLENVLPSLVRVLRGLGPALGQYQLDERNRTVPAEGEIQDSHAVLVRLEELPPEPPVLEGPRPLQNDVPAAGQKGRRHSGAAQGIVHIRRKAVPVEPNVTDRWTLARKLAQIQQLGAAEISGNRLLKCWGWRDEYVRGCSGRHFTRNGFQTENSQKQWYCVATIFCGCVRICMDTAAGTQRRTSLK